MFLFFGYCEFFWLGIIYIFFENMCVFYVSIVFGFKVIFGFLDKVEFFWRKMFEKINGLFVFFLLLWFS